MKSQNFEFLRGQCAELADLGGFAEKYLHDDPASAVAKLWLFAEQLTERIYQTHQLPKPFQAKFVDLLTNGAFTSMVAPVILDKIHLLRKIGNQDVHGEVVPVKDAVQNLNEAYGNADPELVEGDIFRIVVKVPEFEVTGQVTGQVQRLLQVFEKEHSRGELQTRLGLKHRDTFRETYLAPALEAGLVEMTIPDKPNISKQEYRLTEKGRNVVQGLNVQNSGGDHGTD